MGLKAFIEDDMITEALGPYGEIKSEIIRLKYKKDHPLAGVENGNHLVKMILTKTIPYAHKIDGGHCRIIHSDQKQICSNCSEGIPNKDAPPSFATIVPRLDTSPVYAQKLEKTSSQT